MRYSFLKTIIFKSSPLFLRNLLQTVYFKNTSWGGGESFIGSCEDVHQSISKGAVTWNNYPTFFSLDSRQEFQEAFWDGEESRELVLKRKKGRREGRRQERQRKEIKRKIKEEKKKERKKRKTWGSGTNTCTDDQLMNISTAISNRRKNNKQWIENGFCCLSTGFSHSSTHSSCPPWSPCPIASEQCGCPCFFLLPYFIQQVLKKPGLGLDLRIQGGSPKQRMGLPSENFQSLLSFQGCPSWDVTSSSPAYYALLPTSPAPWLVLQENSPLFSVLRSLISFRKKSSAFLKIVLKASALFYTHWIWGR